MIEDFFHQIETELGPLSSDWFEELTVKAYKDGHCPVAVERESSHTEGGMFRAPMGTPGLDSQMSSTPRIFRHRGPRSPDSILGRSPDSGMQTPLSALQWTDSSPGLFGSAKDSPQFTKAYGSLKKNDCFGLLDTPKSSLAQDASAKRISESLGAQLNPDLSWSSSFNTPSAMSPTVILTRKEAQPSPVSFLKDKEVIIVRKLFPSLSKDTDTTSESASTAQHNVTDGNAKGQRPDESFDSVDALWRQTVPDAIKDGNVRNTVESVLDGADDVLSIFFSNTGSALRRVKTKERTKKRGNGVSKEVKSAELSTECCIDNPLAAKLDPDMSPSEYCAASDSKSPLKNKDFSHWSPLSLSDVQDSKAKQECFSELPNEHTNLVSVNSDSEQLVLRDIITQPDQLSSCTVEKQKSCPDSYPERSQPRNSLSPSPALNFSRKARKFVYRVQSPCSLSLGSKRATQGALTEKHYEDPSDADESKQTKDDTCTADSGAFLVRSGLSTVKQVNPATLNMDHGLDMTQLCKAFAEDFSQEVNLEKSPNRSTGIDHNVLITSPCMSQTVEISEVQLKAETEKQCDDHQGFHSNQQEKSAFAKETVNLTNMLSLESMTSENLKHDSGCCVTLSDFSGATTSCNGAGLDHHGFKTANNKIIFTPPEAVMKAKAILDMVEECMTVKVSSPRTDLPKVSHDPVVTSSATAAWPSVSHGQGIGNGEETADFTQNASSEIVADHIPNSFLLRTNDSGFRTASNRSITVSAIHLEKAKDIFKQLEEENSDLCPSNSGKLEVQNVNNARLSKFDFRNNHTNHSNVEGNCFLTASQKADVTELCSMLEDADSQYEFTQFRQAKLCSKFLDSAQHEKEWDPAILSGIDFDDSFNCDIERQASRKHHAKMDKPNQHTAVQSIYESKSFNVPQETSNANLSLTDGSLGPDGKEAAKALKVETKTSEDKSFCIGFKTAKGKSVNISEKYLSKARSLFADLEDCEAHFSTKCDHMKVALEKNEKQLSDHHATEPSPVTCSNEPFGHKKKAELEPESEGNGCKGNTSLVTEETQICSTENLENAQGNKDQKPDVLQFNMVNFGFSTAGGKQLKVSEKSLLNAKKLLNEVANCEEAANKCEAPASLKAQPKTKAVDSSRISLHNSNLLIDALHDSKISDKHLTKGGEQSSKNSTEIRWKMSGNPTPQSIQSNGFKMANGKVVSVSASAIERSKTFFKDIDSSVDTPDETKSKEVNAKLDLKVERSQPVFVSGFKMASGKGVSFSETALMKSKAFFEDCDLDCSDHSQGKGEKSSVMNNCGFKAVKGNMVHSPGLDSLSKNAASLKEEPAFLNKYVEKESTKTSAEILQCTSGFSTASGKMVSVSAEALHRAKSVFDDPNDASPCKKTMEISEEKSVSKTETAVPGRSWGFSTASGRIVTISDKALEKAKNLLTGCEVEGLAPNGGLLNSTKTSSVDPKQITYFNTASDKTVVVPEKAMKEAKAVFAGGEDVSPGLQEIESPLTSQKGQQKSPHSSALSTKNKAMLVNAGSSKGNQKGGNPTPDNFRAGNVGFSTASGKGVSVSKSALQVAFEMFRDCDVQPVTHENLQCMKTECQYSKSSEKCPPEVQELDQIGQTRAATPSLSSQEIHSDASPLTRHSLDINGCTVTQQKYFEQEAMACTKALLEDDLNERSLLETLEDTDSRKSPAVSLKRSLEAAIVEGKWMSDVGLTGQPPLKRRLISEFGQISDRASICAPVKSSPNGTLKDRRVHLKPSITHPSRNFMDQKISSSDLQTASSLSSGQKRGSDPKAVMFVPPFRKNNKSEVEKTCIPRDIAKVPSVFVPPVKKDSVVSVHHVRSSQKSSTDSESPSISSSGCEKKMANPEVKSHTVVKNVVEDMKKEKEVEEDMTLEDLSVQTHQEKVTETWQQSLELARDMQDMRIRKKKRQSIRPLPGSFYLAKTSGVARISLREAVEYKCPLQHTQEQLYQYGVHCNVSQITSENAESFRFSFDDFFKRKAFIENTGVQLADGGWLIPDNRGTMGKEEFYRALCDTPGVDPKLISEAWVFNHYRWIVWKRACMERAFPEVMGSRCLTPEQVLLQLKLRYDTEVDCSQRSALKKIMERDDTPAKTLVLCMCGIAKSGHSEARTEKSVAATDAKSESPAVVIWLTDGWYSIKALLDPPLSAMVQKGRLRIGGKVMIHGAELVGSHDACPPLEAPDSLMLKISANSTRRAHWDSKLGFHKDPRPFRLPLSSLYPNGGVVGCVDIIVLRSYPTQWMEKKSGVFVFRNDRAEDREARRHSSAKQKTMELLFSKIQAQFEREEEDKKKNRRRRRFRCHEIENLQDGEDLYEAMESDPAYVEAHLSAGQMEVVSSYRRSVAEQRQAELQDRLRKAVQEAEEAEGGCPNRDVTPVWKLSITDFNNSNCIYTLNIWRPSVELRSLLREGCRYKAYHLAASMAKKRSGTTSIQFTATKKTRFQDIEVCPEWLSTHFPARQLASFRDLQNPGFSSPCGEVDVVGYVISILDRQAPSPVLYLVDDKFDFVSVRSFSSLVQLALEDLVKPFALLAVSNLQLRELSGPVPRLYAGEQALFSINSKETHLQEAVAHLKTFVQSYENFFSVAEEKLSNLIPPGNLKSVQSPRTLGVPSMPKPNSKMNITPQQSRVFSPFTPVTKRAPASTAQTTEAKDPKSLKRKRGIDYLSRVPSPPPLSPLSIVTSPSVKKTFNPPRRSGPPQLACPDPALTRRSASPAVEEQWVKDEELAMINTQTLVD
ncbi:breast cancer type 2 susceptibility protein isoform X3 [Pygocentrus nattereri]|uniref:Tower domain-containing protein n=1 Tax=Pygocentrus nattereri TaxID=42514 RepID=A0A3B4BU74_PYGNA|nr:breast cancer type 2 susceptibility protein isoform X3 [Pygocentrus nattereri]